MELELFSIQFKNRILYCFLIADFYIVSQTQEIQFPLLQNAKLGWF